jgi:hypothetical protein
MLENQDITETLNISDLKVLALFAILGSISEALELKIPAKYYDESVPNNAEKVPIRVCLNISETAKKLDISARTAQRSLDKLVRLGYLVECHNANPLQRGGRVAHNYGQANGRSDCFVPEKKDLPLAFNNSIFLKKILGNVFKKYQPKWTIELDTIKQKWCNPKGAWPKKIRLPK